MSVNVDSIVLINVLRIVILYELFSRLVLGNKNQISVKAY